MRRNILRLKGKVPGPLWQHLKRQYWSRVWEEEFHEEAKALGVLSLQPIEGSERAMLTEAISEWYPFRRVLEVGSSFGQNFVTLARHYPQVRFTGIDADRERIFQGREVLKSYGIRNAELEVARAEDLSCFPDNSFDLVYCCALLLYIPPDAIEAVLREMIRTSRKAVLLMEMHQENPNNPQQASGAYVLRRNNNSGYWVRDYRAMLERLIEPTRIKLTSIANPRWSAEQWMSLGHVVEVDLRR